ncbi:Thoeris anti-defense Tad2 family protein, partial [Bacillus cereus]
MEGRSRIMNFGKALELMKSGNKLSRKGWNGK